MFNDTRLANYPLWFLDQPKDWNMRIPDQIKDCVVFVGRVVGGDPVKKHVCRGTAFLVGIPADVGQRTYVYLVTAAHTARQLSLGEKWFVRYNRKSGGVKEIIIENRTWYYHPTESSSVDAAVMIFPPLDDDMDFKILPFAMFASDSLIADRGIGIGDLVHFVGLLTKTTGKSRNMPVVRTGNIALVPSEKIPIKFGDALIESEVYIVEARSLGGLSGSPVFVRETIIAPFAAGRGERTVQVLLSGELALLGLMHGHWNIKSEDYNEIEMPAPLEDESALNLGMAVVVPAKKILEILNQSVLVDFRKLEDLQYARTNETVPDWP